MPKFGKRKNRLEKAGHFTEFIFSSDNCFLFKCNTLLAKLNRETLDKKGN